MWPCERNRPSTLPGEGAGETPGTLGARFPAGKGVLGRGGVVPAPGWAHPAPLGVGGPGVAPPRVCVSLGDGRLEIHPIHRDTGIIANIHCISKSHHNQIKARVGSGRGGGDCPCGWVLNTDWATKESEKGIPSDLVARGKKKREEGKKKKGKKCQLFFARKETLRFCIHAPGSAFLSEVVPPQPSWAAPACFSLASSEGRARLHFSVKMPVLFGCPG